MAKIKRHLSKDEEFQIMKLVLDKMLWLGTIIMAYGFYRLIASNFDWMNLYILLAGAIVMFLFTWILLKEYNFMK